MVGTDLPWSVAFVPIGGITVEIPSLIAIVYAHSRDPIGTESDIPFAIDRLTVAEERNE